MAKYSLKWIYVVEKITMGYWILKLSKEVKNGKIKFKISYEIKNNLKWPNEV